MRTLTTTQRVGVVDAEEMVVSASLEVPADRPFDASVVLRGFDELRRDLALQVDGQTGIGLGYDLLDISWSRLREVQAASRVTLTAELLARRPGGHQVEYQAGVVPTVATADSRSTLIIRARGWTLSPPADPAADVTLG